jgi:hypothetical protein
MGVDSGAELFRHAQAIFDSRLPDIQKVRSKSNPAFYNEIHIVLFLEVADVVFAWSQERWSLEKTNNRGVNPSAVLFALAAHRRATSYT